MKTIISIDGGIGRIIAAIPALLKYAKLHPDEDWYVMIPSWDIMTWGFSELQQRTFNPETKGVFENYYWDADNVISPEPYKLPKFYRNEISLREAFDVLINETDDHSDLPEMQLKLTLDELIDAKQIINNIRRQNNNKKIIVMQPFGSSAYPTEVGIYDKSMRSINHYMTKILIDKLSKDYVIINMCSGIYNQEGLLNIQPDPSLRVWAGIIGEADYFIGCDSCGQHMAKAVGVPSSVVIAGTHEVNMSYPDTFHIIKREGIKYYPAPMRVSGINSMLCDKLNEERNAFTEDEINNTYKEIVKRIAKTPNKSVEIPLISVPSIQKENISDHIKNILTNDDKKKI
jgi:hypothetical protein